MKRIILAIFIVLSFNLSAQTESKFTGSLLWKVSGKDLTRPSYIMGSHHIIGVDFTDSIAGFSEALEVTQQVVGEIVMTDKAEIEAKMQAKALMPPEYSYKQILTDDEYAKMDAKVQEIFGGGMDKMSFLHPAMLGTVYSILLFTKAYPDVDIQNIQSIDEFVQEKAIEAGKNVIGLETAEFQIALLFETESIEDQVKDLACSFLNSEYLVATLVNLTNQYIKGDLNGLYKTALDPSNPCPSSEKMENDINKKRNDEWLKKLPEIMKETSSFIVVGALHIAGEEGILHQLDNLGYTVEAVH